MMRLPAKRIHTGLSGGCSPVPREEQFFVLIMTFGRPRRPHIINCLGGGGRSVVPTSNSPLLVLHAGVREPFLYGEDNLWNYNRAFTLATHMIQFASILYVSVSCEENFSTLCGHYACLNSGKTVFLLDAVDGAKNLWLQKAVLAVSDVVDLFTTVRPHIFTYKNGTMPSPLKQILDVHRILTSVPW